MQVFGDPDKTEEYGTPHPDATDVEGVVILGYDHSADKWLALEWGQTRTIWLPGGGKEKSETFEAAAVRELKEETGYADFNDVIQLGGPIVSHYYNEKKDVYRKSYSYSYLFLLNSARSGRQELEEHENFSVVWLNYDDLVKALQQTGGGVEHWLAVLERARVYVQQTP